MKCELCQREVNRLTVHHLIPRQAVKRKKADSGPTVQICFPCHRQIHHFFSNLELAQNYNTLDKLKNEPRMQKFLSWLHKQRPDKRIKIG